MLNDKTPETLDEALESLESAEVPEAPTAPAEESAPAPDAQPRDEQGRFAKAPEESPAEPPAPTPEAPPPPTEPVAPEPETYDELTYRADGQEFSLSGSAVGEDGVFIPTEQVAELQQLLAEGRAARGSVRQRLSEAAQREQQAVKAREAAEAQSQAILAHFEQLIESQKIGDWLQNVQQNWPILKAEARAKALELAQQAERAELTRYREQSEYQRLRPMMEQTLERAIAERGAMLGLDDETLGDVYELLHAPDMESTVFVRAPVDDAMAGFRKGDLVINYQPVDKALQLAAASARRLKAAKKAAPVPATPIPPTVGGRGAKAPRPGKAVPSFTSREEADKWFERGGYEELDIPEA